MLCKGLTCSRCTASLPDRCAACVHVCVYVRVFVCLYVCVILCDPVSVHAHVHGLLLLCICMREEIARVQSSSGLESVPILNHCSAHLSSHTALPHVFFQCLAVRNGQLLQPTQLSAQRLHTACECVIFSHQIALQFQPKVGLEDATEVRVEE